ncbi:MAG TPA: hypothetical protein VJ964_12990 [Balneolaceae bacterium]|nr:hypothetical protein [Balneolaceae bacterium]
MLEQLFENAPVGIAIDQHPGYLEGELLWPAENQTYQKFECFFTRKNGNGPARKILEQSEA